MLSAGMFVWHSREGGGDYSVYLLRKKTTSAEELLLSRGTANIALPILQGSDSVRLIIMFSAIPTVLI